MPVKFSGSWLIVCVDGDNIVASSRPDDTSGLDTADNVVQSSSRKKKKHRTKDSVSVSRFAVVFAHEGYSVASIGLMQILLWYSVGNGRLRWCGQIERRSRLLLLLLIPATTTTTVPDHQHSG